LLFLPLVARWEVCWKPQPREAAKRWLQVCFGKCLPETKKAQWDNYPILTDS
jgi:hypothetical protein